MRRRWFLYLALLVGLLSGVYTYNYLVSLDQRVAVPVAARDLERFARVEEHAWQISWRGENEVHDRAILDPAHLEGRRVKFRIMKGEPFLEPRLMKAGADSYEPVLEDGELAFFLPLKEERFPPLLSDEDLVDVILYHDAPMGVAATGNIPARAKVVMRSIRILRVTRGGGQDGGPSDPVGVTLALLPHQVEKMVFALEIGQIYLAVSSPGTEQGTTAGTTWPQLYFDELEQAGGEEGSHEILPGR